MIKYLDRRDQSIEAYAGGLVVMMLGPVLIAKTPPRYVWLAVALVAAAGVGSTLVYFINKVTPGRNFALVLIPSLLLIFNANMLTGGPAGRFSMLYYLVVLFATDLSGLKPGIAAAVVALALDTATLHWGNGFTSRALEIAYIHGVLLAVTVAVGTYLAWRSQLLIHRLEAIDRLALELHRENQPQAVLRSLVTSANEVTKAAGTVLYQDGLEGPKVLASEGHWSKDLYETVSQPQNVTEFRFMAANDVYNLALQKPKYQDQRMWEGVRTHFHLALIHAKQQAITSIELQQWIERSQRAHLETVEALIAMLEKRDAYTAGHSRRVASYAAHLARRLQQSEAVTDVVRRGSLVHDIGKMSLSDSILLKPGPLTDEEWLEVRKHPDAGVEILGKFTGLDDFVPIVRWHHERWDGRGYPDGLAGEDIPLTARIVAVADAFDAMTTSRTYKRPRNSADARAVLREGAGSQWCPVCANAMADMIGGRRTLAEKFLT